MEEKKIDPISPGMTSNSSHIASVYGNDFLELVWQNGQILVQGGSSPTSSRTEKRPSCFGYSLNPCREGYDEDPSITKKARLNTLYSLFDSSHQNSQQTRDQPSYLFDCKYIKSNSFSNKLGDEFSNSRAGSKETNSKPTTVGNTQLCSSSSQSQKHDDSGSDQGIGKLNFSNFLRPALFLKSAYQGSTATQPRNGAVSARVEEFKAATDAAANANSKAPDHSVVIDSSNKGSHSPNGLQHHEDQTALTSHKANRTPFVAKTDQETVLPDQHSEAIKTQESHGQYHNQTHKAKRKSAAELYNEPMVASSSLCSLGASNDPTLRSRKHEDTDDSTYISDNDEEPEDVIKDTPAREGLRGKRSRNAAIHNLSERKRRDKINKKMRALKELIPNCNKMDKASMLDDAIDYLRTLKLQLQVMSMGSGLCMPLMMLPGGGGGHHIPQLMGGGMSLRPSGIGIPYSLPPQYPNIPHLSLHAHGHGGTDNTLHMLGFPNHMLPMPFSMSPPFIPMPSNVCATQASNQGTN